MQNLTVCSLELLRKLLSFLWVADYNPTYVYTKEQRLLAPLGSILNDKGQGYDVA